VERAKLFRNGRIYTLDAAGTTAQAVACWQGRIVAVGDDPDVRAHFPSFSEVDLGGLVVFPAFTDAHIHLTALGFSLLGVNLEGVRSIGEAVARVAEAVRSAPPGAWVLGRGWNRNVWPEGRWPTKDDLDPVSPHNPVALWSKDGHVLWCNALALQKAGIGPDTPDPPGGEIVRQDGEPTGVLKEAASALATRAIPPPADEEVERAILEATRLLHRLGITGVHHMAGSAEGTTLPVLQHLHREGRLGVRVVAAIPETSLDDAIRMGLRSGLGDEWLRVGFVKIFADGTLGSQTAAMLTPFTGQPDNTGIALHGHDELAALVRRASRAGWACAVHAIGDRANRWALDAFEASLEHSRRLGLRHRIEHAQLIHPDDLPRFARLGVVASMQPVHCPADRDLADRYWGERSKHAYAWRSLLRSGAVLAFGSDAPVETPDVLRGLYAAAFRRDPQDPRGPWYPEEAIPVLEAIRAYTLGAAYAAGEEHQKGSLEVGKVCDLVAVDWDIVREPEALADARVRLTVIGGEIVYEAL